MCLAPILVSSSAARAAASTASSRRVDLRLAALRGLGALALGVEPLALADEALELADLLQEAVGALVFLRAGLGASRRSRWSSRRRRRCDGPRSRRAQALAESDHVLERGVEREDGLAHLPLAGLDLLGDGDLLLAGEERERRPSPGGTCGPGRRFRRARARSLRPRASPRSTRLRRPSRRAPRPTRSRRLPRPRCRSRRASRRPDRSLRVPRRRWSPRACRDRRRRRCPHDSRAAHLARAASCRSLASPCASRDGHSNGISTGRGAGRLVHASLAGGSAHL